MHYQKQKKLQKLAFPVKQTDIFICIILLWFSKTYFQMNLLLLQVYSLRLNPE